MCLMCLLEVSDTVSGVPLRLRINKRPHQERLENLLVWWCHFRVVTCKENTFRFCDFDLKSWKASLMHIAIFISSYGVCSTKMAY